MTDHWNHYHLHWSRLGPPLRPTPGVRDAVVAAVGPAADIALLGVTPELATLGQRLLAVDASAGMISGLWAGDTAQRQARVGDWLALPLPAASMDAVIGDGCLTVLPTPAEHRRLFAELARVLRPGGRVAIRLFASPAFAEPIETLADDAGTGRIETFHALKWRLAMALAARSAEYTVAVTEIREAVQDLFPDRERLARQTGWPRETIDTIDVYAGSDAVYGFSTADDLVARAAESFGRVGLVPTTGYSLSERCPLLVLGDPVQPARGAK